MAAVATISRAIQLGAPAYNAGEVMRCAELYEEAAANLLRSHRSELKPQVADRLNETLTSAAELRAASALQADGADQLAWAFRRAFDAQLEQAAVGDRGASRAAAQAGSVADVVQAAIARGAPTFNAGDAAGCASIYEATIQGLLARSDISTESKERLGVALDKAARSSGASEQAWTLRKALDEVMASSGSPSQRSSGASWQSPQAGAQSRSEAGAQTICNFMTGEGLTMEASIINDTVMGGRSQSRVETGSEGAIFNGTVTRAGGGGFASIRFQPVDGEADLGRLLASGSGVRVRTELLRGCAAWKFQINESSRLIGGFLGAGSQTQWQASFQRAMSSGVSETDIPFSSFVPTFRGRPQGDRGMPREARECASSVGFMLSFLTDVGGNEPRFEEGPFSLHILSIEVY